MTEQERINTDLQRQIDAQNSRIDNVLTKVDGLIQSLQDFKDEMRDRDNQRAEEMRHLDNQRAEDIREIRASLDSMGKHVRTLALTSMGAIGAMVIAVGAMFVTVVYSIFK